MWCDAVSGTDPDRTTARRPRAVYGSGSEPDARFSLANERTALAWVRTGLAVVAGGIALTTAATFAAMPLVIDVMAMAACVVGGLLALSSLWSWSRAERALRRDLPLPAPVMLPVLAVAVFLGGLVLAGVAVYQAIHR